MSISMCYILIFSCSHFAKIVLTQDYNDSNKTNDQDERIVGGKKANKRFWPFMVVISCGKVAFCGGTLIKSKWIITAAHCVHEEHTKECRDRFGSLNVKVGPDDLTNVDATEVLGPEERKSSEEIVSITAIKEERVPEEIESIFIHSKFFHENIEGENGSVVISGFDIALIKLKNALEDVDTARLPNSSVYNAWNCVTAGWGATSLNEQKINGTKQQLRMIALHPINHDSCEKDIQYLLKYQGVINYDELGEKDAETKICCHAKNPGQYVFRGDTGGPLMCDSTLQGITSAMFLFSNREVYTSVFTDFSTCRDWFDEVLKEHDAEEYSSQMTFRINRLLLIFTSVIYF